MVYNNIGNYFEVKSVFGKDCCRAKKNINKQQKKNEINSFVFPRALF